MRFDNPDHRPEVTPGDLLEIAWLLGVRPLHEGMLVPELRGLIRTRIALLERAGKLDLEFDRFESWAAVVAHCKAGLPLYYHALLDRRPVLVHYTLPKRKPRGSTVPGDGWKGCIRIVPLADADPFVAFGDHLSRMRRKAPGSK